jgi:anaerobic magnesium-protoporphyrin IX monomethyl ester cyclase
MKDEARKSPTSPQIAIGFIQANNEIDVQWYKPLVFGYLKAYLEKKLPFSVKMELVEHLNQIQEFHILGISSTSQNFASALSIARQAKQAAKGIITILGGHHVTYLHNTMTPDFDIGVIGEGEQTFFEIVEAILAEGGLPGMEILQAIRGIVYWHNGKLVTTRMRPLISPLDSLPHPYRFAEDKTYIFTSRGCPFNCSFCSSSAFWHKTRFFSSEYVVEEIEQLLERFPAITHLPIQDDLFIANQSRLLEIIEMLEARKIADRVNFSFSVRANLVTDEMCQTLSRLKIVSVSFGAESGSDRILRLMNKNATVAQNQKALDFLHRYGINTICSFIVGWPTETEEEVKQTFEFIRNNVLEKKLPTRNAINILMPIPGTSLWDESVKSGKIDPQRVDWSQLSIFADYQHSRLESFDRWVVQRRQNRSLYLAEDTLPQERLYRLMAAHYEAMSHIEKERQHPPKRTAGSNSRATELHETIAEIEQALFDQRTAIHQWKQRKALGRPADDSALMASSRFFQAVLGLADLTSSSDRDSMVRQKAILNMTSCYREMEAIGKRIAACDTLETVNQVIDEQLIPRLNAWPSLLRTILQPPAGH